MLKWNNNAQWFSTFMPRFKTVKVKENSFRTPNSYAYPILRNPAINHLLYASASLNIEYSMNKYYVYFFFFIRKKNLLDLRKFSTYCFWKFTHFGMVLNTIWLHFDGYMSIYLSGIYLTTLCGCFTNFRGAVTKELTCSVPRNWIFSCN